jgi:glucokinase
MKKTLAIGVDIGGSHISCAAVDLSSYSVINETRTNRYVDNSAEAEQIISDWVQALDRAIRKIPGNSILGIGFGMPGPFDYVNGISFIKGVAKYENLYGCNIKNAISDSLDLFDDMPVRFMNDVSSFAVGEALIGKASNTERSFALTLGTGLGSAFIANRIPVVDGTEVPRLGCVYHLPYGEGIADDYFSTRWFIGRYKELTGEELRGVKEFAELAGSDKIVMDLFREFGMNLAIFLAPWLRKFGAEIVVIGGNISNAYSLFGDIFEDNLKKEECRCSVAISELKEDAALIGSAYLMDEDFWKQVQPALPFM